MGSVTSPRPWQEIRDAKKEEQTSRIPVEWRLKELPSADVIDLRPLAASSGILSDRELEITEIRDATALAADIAVSRFSAEEVAVAFCKRAAIGQQLCNNLTEIMFLDAIKDAKKLDEHLKTTGKTVGPLHGLPMTFKECFHVRGYDACNGYISRCFETSTRTTYLIEIVKQAGAVIIAKTNTPQTMIAAESHNNVFGQTKNPVVSHLTPGGSSGGEGSNIAFRGSAIGIGTDVGGSIRIPAAANGVYGYKPTSGILPFIGYAASGYTGVNTGVPAVPGPIAHSVRDLTLLTSVVRSAKPWLVDPSVIPHVFESILLTRKPIIGIIHESGVTPHPPVQRAIREAEAKLRSAGYDVRSFTPVPFDEIRTVTRQLFTIDGLSYQKREIGKAGEPVVESVRKIGFWDIERKTPEEMWEWNTKKLIIQAQMLTSWQDAGVDVVICPAGPHTAVKPGDWTNDMYTVAWNAVDYPAVIVPFTKADPVLDPKQTDFRPSSELDKANEVLYDPTLMAGAPVALQIVGMKYEDAQLLKDAELLDQVLNA